MKLFFTQGGSRWKFDDQGNIYTDSNFNNNVWMRYRSLCDELIVLLRREEKIYQHDEAEQKFNAFDKSIATAIAVPDVYQPRRNAFNLRLRRIVKSTIEEQVKKADKIIIRSLGNIYTNTAIRCARKYNKPYLVEVTGFAFESLWNHGFYGKLVAIPKERQYKSLMKDVDYAVYVTKEALQKRYPCRGRSLGCSDVELPILNDDILENRLNKIAHTGSIITLGTAALLDVRWKGQKYVINALYELKKRGINTFRYVMIGVGTGRELREQIKHLGLDKEVIIEGALAHDKVFPWLDSIDVYIQPSFQEGLCRAIVEAMGRACPVVCSDVGGNFELVDDAFLFKKGDTKSLVEVLLKIVNKDVMSAEAKNSFNKAKGYEKVLLDSIRNGFYKEFVSTP